MLFLSFVASQTLLPVTKLMFFIEGNVDIFFKWPKKQGRRGTLAYSYFGMWSIERTLRTFTNNGFQDQYGNTLSLLKLQQTKRSRSFLSPSSETRATRKWPSYLPRFSRLRRLRARAFLSLNLKKRETARSLEIQAKTFSVTETKNSCKTLKLQFPRYLQWTLSATQPFLVSSRNAPPQVVVNLYIVKNQPGFTSGRSVARRQ